MNGPKGLTSRVHKPIVFLSVVCFFALALLSYFLIQDLVNNSIRDQAKSTAKVFTNSIRDDILNGFDKEVFRKCQSLFKNTLVDKIYVEGLDHRVLCEESKGGYSNTFDVASNIYFNPDLPEVAGLVKIQFQSDLANQLIWRVGMLLLITILVLLGGYWFVSIYLVKKETDKFTQLASLLTESRLDKLETCSHFFPGEQTKELNELCEGVEMLSKNWRAYQEEQIKTAKLQAIHQSSRVLAHDIKSPLGAIKTVSQILIEKPAQSKKLLDQGIERIETMLSDLVKKNDVDRANLVSVDIGDFISKLQKEVQSVYDSIDGLKIEFFLDVDNGSEIAEIDVDLVGRALRNLIKNSIEALDSRGVIKVHLIKTPYEFSISVHDNGPGLPEELLVKVGQSDLLSTKEGGSGLGLYQVKKTMDLHLGHLQVSVDNGTLVKMIFK